MNVICKIVTMMKITIIMIVIVMHLRKHTISMRNCSCKPTNAHNRTHTHTHTHTYLTVGRPRIEAAVVEDFRSKHVIEAVGFVVNDRPSPSARVMIRKHQTDLLGIDRQQIQDLAGSSLPSGKAGAVARCLRIDLLVGIVRVRIRVAIISSIVVCYIVALCNCGVLDAFSVEGAIRRGDAVIGDVLARTEEDTVISVAGTAVL